MMQTKTVTAREQTYACGCKELAQDGSNPRFCPEHDEPWTSEETLEFQIAQGGL